MKTAERLHTTEEQLLQESKEVIENLIRVNVVEVDEDGEPKDFQAFLKSWDDARNLLIKLNELK